MRRKSSIHGAVALALATLLSGCGHAGAPDAPANHDASVIAATASVATAAAGRDSDGARVPYVDPQLVPIAKADIDLYLDVMQAAAGRVQHPTADDMAALRALKDFDAKSRADTEANAPLDARAQAEQAQLEAKMNAAMQSGDMAALKALSAQQVKLIQDQQKALHVTQPLDDATMQLATHLTLGQADEVIVDERHLDADHWQRVVDVIEEVFPPPDAAVGDCGGDCAPELTAEQLRREHEHEAGVARNRRILAPYEKQIHALEAVVREGRS